MNPITPQEIKDTVGYHEPVLTEHIISHINFLLKKQALENYKPKRNIFPLELDLYDLEYQCNKSVSALKEGIVKTYVDWKIKITDEDTIRFYD